MRVVKKAWIFVSMKIQIVLRKVPYKNGSPDVLGEENALELNDEEVDKFRDVASQALESLVRNGVVLSGTHAGRKALAKDKLAGNFSGSGDTEDGECCLQDIALDRDVAGEENAGDDGGEGNGGGTRVLPAEERVEQRVVVGQVLAGGSLVLGSLAGRGQVGELVLGGGGLSAGLVGDRTIGNGLDGLGVLDGAHGVGGGCFWELGRDLM